MRQSYLSSLSSANGNASSLFALWSFCTISVVLLKSTLKPFSTSFSPIAAANVFSQLQKDQKWEHSYLPWSTCRQKPGLIFLLSWPQKSQRNHTFLSPCSWKRGLRHSFIETLFVTLWSFLLTKICQILWVWPSFSPGLNCSFFPQSFDCWKFLTLPKEQEG